MKYPPLVLAAALLTGCPPAPHANPVDRGSIAFDGDALVATIYTAAGDQLVRFRPDYPAETVIAGNGADGASASAPFTIDGGEVFYAGCRDDGTCSIFAVPSSGGPARTIVDLDRGELSRGADRHNALLRGIAVDGQSVYWMDSGIWSAPRAGGAATRLGDGVTSRGYSDFVSTLAIDAGALWAARENEGVVERIPLDGSVPTLFPTSAALPFKVIAAGGIVYWGNAGALSADCYTAGSSIESWSGSGAPQQVVTNIDGLIDFTVVDGIVLWEQAGVSCDGIPRGLVFQRRPGASATVELNAGGSPGAIASDGKYVYSVGSASTEEMALRN